MMQASTSRILILRLSSIGDIILTSAFVRQVRTRYKDAVIDFVIKEQYLDLIKNNPNLDNIYTLAKTGTLGDLNTLRKNIENNDYTHIFDLHNNLRTRALLKNSKSSRISRIKKNKIKRAILVYLKLNLFKQTIPIPQRYLNTAIKAGVKDDHLGLELFFDNTTIDRVNGLIDVKFSNEKFIAIAPGASYFTKQWPLDFFKQWIELYLEKQNGMIVLLGGPEVQGKFSDLILSERVVDLTGQLSQIESVYMIKMARGLVSNDSGLMHMATAVQTPVLAIFGSTVQELGFAPFRSKHTIAENKTLWCRPCSHVGRTKCPLGHFRCMKEIRPENVYNQFINLLNLKP